MHAISADVKLEEVLYLQYIPLFVISNLSFLGRFSVELDRLNSSFVHAFHFK